ncbi:MAG: hypothetical protein AB2392_14955 [Neobacillus sp.]
MRPKLFKGIIIGAVAGTIIGSLIGLELYGNYPRDVIFNGVRGYEAFGQIGAIIGGLFGAVCGFFLVFLIALNRNRKLK